MGKFRNGVYVFKKTGTRYYLQVYGSAVSVYRGDKPKYINYCGTRTLEQVEVLFQRATRRQSL